VRTMACTFREEVWTEYGRQVKRLVMENELILVWIEPWDGGRVTRLYDKLKHHDHIWTNGRTRRLARVYGGNYDDLSNGGIEEAFPTVASCEYNQAVLPFFGEVWSAPWDYLVCSCSDKEIIVQLSCSSSIFPANLVKTYTIAAGSPELHTDLRIENIGVEPFEYVFGIHPSICIDESTEIAMPAGQFGINYLYPAGLETSREFLWPNFGSRDLSKAWSMAENTCINFLTGECTDGSYSFYNRNMKSGIAIQFDGSFFRCLSIWLIYGGWRGHYCAMTEFFTSWPASLKEASEQGLARKLDAKDSQSTSVVYSIF
jgi:hypothetical protein